MPSLVSVPAPLPIIPEIEVSPTPPTVKPIVLFVMLPESVKVPLSELIRTALVDNVIAP